MSQPDSARSLMVEDTSKHISVFSAILKQAGDQLSSAKNGPQGLAIATKNVPGLIPLDIFVAGRRFTCAARGPGGTARHQRRRDGVADDRRSLRSELRNTNFTNELSRLASL